MPKKANISAFAQGHSAIQRLAAVWLTRKR